MPRLRARSWRAFDPSAVRSVSRPVPVAGSRVRILGLDPGSRRTGYGLIDCGGPKAVHIAHGCIAPSAACVASRLRAIFEAVHALIGEMKPDEIAVERVFVNRNVDSALKLGQARGAALCAVPHGVPVFEYAPRAIKMSVVGFGGAEKRQVAHMMRTLLSLADELSADAADALAVAICHAHSRRMHAIELAARAALAPAGLAGPAK